MTTNPRLLPMRPVLSLAAGVLLSLAGCGGAAPDGAQATASAAPGATQPAAAEPAARTPAGGAGGDFASRTGELTNPDDATMVFLYYDLAGLPPPLDDWTEQNPRVRFAPGPDKAARRAEVHAQLAAAQRAVAGVGVLHLTMQANLSDYDPAYGEFTVRALSPSSQVSFKALDQQVVLGFDNALDAQSWAVPAGEAQAIRDRLGWNGAQIDLTLKIDKVLPGPQGGTLVARVLRYDLREASGNTLLGHVEVAPH